MQGLMQGLLGVEGDHLIVVARTEDTAMCLACGQELRRYTVQYDGHEPYDQWFTDQEVQQDRLDDCEHEVN